MKVCSAEDQKGKCSAEESSGNLDRPFESVAVYQAVLVYDEALWGQAKGNYQRKNNSLRGGYRLKQCQ